MSEFPRIHKNVSEPKDEGKVLFSLFKVLPHPPPHLPLADTYIILMYQLMRRSFACQNSPGKPIVSPWGFLLDDALSD